MSITLKEIKNIAQAFPFKIRETAEELLLNPEFSSLYETQYFEEIYIENQPIKIPARIYHDKSVLPNLNKYSTTEQEILCCIFSRHYDGYVRQYAIRQLINSDNLWVTPFIVMIMGEYVIEILEEILQNFESLDKTNLTSFILENPMFFDKTQSRVVSYWNCYYRLKYPVQWKGVKLPEEKQYPGFRLIKEINILLKHG